MDHRELIFIFFGRDDLDRHSLEIIAEEDNSLVDSWVRGPHDQLEPAALDHAERALPGDPVPGG